MSKVTYEEVQNLVDTIRLTKRTFNKQIVCNGKLRAIEKSDLTFATSGIIAEVKVVNGTNVKKGDLLASLETKEALLEVKRAEGRMEKAVFELKDKLIGQGFGIDTSGVPAETMNIVKITSGYNDAKELLETAGRRLNDCFLYAPFSGKTADIDLKVHQRSTDKFCTLIDDRYFDVEFSLLEAELKEVAVSQKVLMCPFISQENTFEGLVTQINPVVDDKGQIKVRAKVQNKDGSLIEGMNVKVIIQKELPDRFVVPKDAVVTRDGYSVMFRYVDGKALWTYVEVLASNIDQHVVIGNK